MNIYCEYCKKFVKIIYKFSIKTYKVKELDITSEAKETFCQVCGQGVYDKRSEIENDIVFFDVYKSKNGLLTSKEIKGIRSKYGISQTLYAKILGFGEKTIARYETGSIQDVSQDQLMRLSILENNFLELLKRRFSHLTQSEKDKIKHYLSSFNI